MPNPILLALGLLAGREAGTAAPAGARPPPWNPPLADGLEPWKGGVPKELTAWSVELVNDNKGHPMWSYDAFNVGNKTAIARIEWHTWSHRQGKLVTGLFRGCTLYQVKAGFVAPQPT